MSKGPLNSSYAPKVVHISAPVGSTLLLAAADVAYRSGQTAVPALSREFRGAWIATVNNIDWPSKPGLPWPSNRKNLLISSIPPLN